MPETTLDYNNLRNISDQLRRGEDFGEVLAECLNRYDFLGFSKAVGARMVEKHRTLQGCFVRFVLDALVAYADEYEKQWQGYTDPRNEGALLVAKQIKQMIENEQIKRPPFI